MIEKFLVAHCSPTLANLKTANLFNFRYVSEDKLNYQIEKWNGELNPKGVTIAVLRIKSGDALIYVYREGKLEADLKRDGVEDFLTKMGYDDFTVNSAIQKLSNRFSFNDEFPHEIGLFLGYPLGDVKGFVENKGRASKCAGCWKVYDNECKTVKLFEKFKKCRAIYWRLFQNGTSITRLTVAA